jgi:hypothetical protein
MDGILKFDLYIKVSEIQNDFLFVVFNTNSNAIQNFDEFLP